MKNKNILILLVLLLCFIVTQSSTENAGIP